MVTASFLYSKEKSGRSQPGKALSRKLPGARRRRPVVDDLSKNGSLKGGIMVENELIWFCSLR